MRKLFTPILLLVTFSIQAQNVGVNATGAAPNSSAILDVAATNKGLLIPQVILTSSTDAVTIPTPANSLLVYNTSTSILNGLKGAGYYYNSGTSVAPVWVRLVSALNGYADTTQAWLTTGNIGTDTAINFLGTIDSMPLRFKLNNTWAGQWDAKRGNYFIGRNAGSKNTSGYDNIANGDHALYSNTTGFNNIALGDSALFSNTTGYNNIALGDSALYSNTTGYYNIAHGKKTLFSNTTGIDNIANGAFALYSNTTGDFNIANGRVALYSNTTGSNNIANGALALYLNTTGSNNIANGNDALHDNTTGSNNIANGFRSLYNNTTGYGNIASGKQALYSNTIGRYNIVLGDSVSTPFFRQCKLEFFVDLIN